ncbi:hypothetical protein CONLIGDRAFT_484122 [Coniochaeta ligniaria NRRL 30616]|uniref:RecQ-mediated genome instability protein 1 n=1 Tax=Coniochaeta ligniaria NRRL 30616 TaxID=1408157 RepID=A0A1J7J098_9PEZI|nr:hypothetical protein CONLIGDRAFT_484122 [Coniochaeta ligniaria NRRL 30616]
MPPQDLQSSLLASLSSQSLPLPSQSWLTTLLSSRGNPPPPLPSLTATVRARLLASDLTTPSLLDATYISSHSLPPAITRPDVRSTTLNRDVVLQVLDIENLSQSRWSQVEELEALARGEGTKGREVVRLPVGGEEEEGERGVTQATQTQAQTQTQGRTAGRGAAAVAATVAPSSGTHKLVLQDCSGLKVSGLELKRVPKIAIGTLNIGEKILVKSGASVSRGVIMLEPTTCVVLGGRVEVWHKAWVDGRLARLKEAATTAAAAPAAAERQGPARRQGQ